jgi:hypothetical protein|tara:strand:+ start:6011 stop:6766 length:756 start_codon:yes stop_codon:yes gene_type:complete
MGFLNNTSVTVDAVLTKKGRELLARGQDEFKITKFALADDEIDYRLWDTAHPNGSNYYGAVIENMPLLEAFVDENQILRYKLVSLPKNTAKLPILEVPSPSLVFNGPGITQTITPNTRNGSDAEGGYSFVLHDATIANLTPVIIRKNKKRRKSKKLKLGAAQKFGAAALMNEFDFIQKEDIADLQMNTGATTPVFLNEEERKRSITLSGHSVNLVSRSVTTDTSTNITVVGLSTGATYNVAVTIKADQSTL